MSSGIVWRIYVGFVADIDIKILGIMTLIGDIKSRTGHGRRTIDSKGEYMGFVAHEEATKFSHNNQELGGLTIQRQILDTSSTCLLVICCLAALLFGEVNVLHTHIELVVDVTRGTWAPSWLNIFFNGPRSIDILNSYDAKITTTHA
jgi:hypothetical protein